MSSTDHVNHPAPVWLWLVTLILGALFVFNSPALGQEFITEPEGSVSLAQGTSAVLVSPVSFSRVSMANPDVAEAVVMSPNEVLINGRNLGTTTFVVWDTTGVRRIYGVEVTADAGALDRRLQTLFPTEDIEVTAQGGTLMLSGAVSSAFVARRALELAEGTGAVLIDNLQTPAPSQIRLQVRFAEVSRTALKALGNQLIDVLNPQDLSTDGDWRAETDSDGEVQLSLINSNAHLRAIIKALSETGDFKSLAEPTLLALDGETASFLAGGEFPFPTVQGAQNSNAVSIEWREFGVRLNFTPNVTNIGNIRLAIAPEVSTLDFAGGLTISGFQLPSILSRRAETRVELREGQHLAIAGLLDRSLQESIRKLPILGDIPILGSLFRTTDERQQVTELLVIVSPSIVVPSDNLPEMPTGDPASWDWDDQFRPAAADTARASGVGPAPDEGR
ncbi:MAG: pilus assembly protein N-terminal domain-containing protein [Gemmatimonadales bacterium]|jgi:pilus assembly protein CpaC|nr:MAG: pilus assembly protein N-terminal domain-containing protein [Gemmatimonadales bacterium]